MLFGLQTKALIVVGVICGTLVAGLATMTWLYGNAKTELGYQEALVAELNALNEKHIDRIKQLQADAEKADRANQWLARQLNEAEQRAGDREDETRELERTDESYAEYRDADMHPVTDRRLRDDADCTRSRILAVQGAEQPDPRCTAADENGQ